MATQNNHLLISIAAICLIIASMKAAAPILNPLFLSIFIAIICIPSLTWLNKKGFSSTLAVTLVMCALFIGIGILGVYVASSVDEFSKQLPSYQHNLKQQTATMVQWLEAHGMQEAVKLDTIKEFDASKAMKFVGGLITSLGTVFADMFLIQLT
ncbi:MAG: AI-2E family transporter, partial [Methyloprofundus sp.]|nr:AI-2E family transporter [Methyloprofundus sp.]